MQLTHLIKVIGQAFAVKPNGIVLPITSGMTLSIGDVFFVHEGKNAWLVNRDGEQIDILDCTYLITTKGNTQLDINLESTSFEPAPHSAKESEPELRVKTEELVLLHGLTNEQAKALILTRYRDYFSHLNTDENPLSFEPQVFRIAENQAFEYTAKELASCIQGAKCRSFSIASIAFDEKVAEIKYDDKHFSITPKIAPANDIKIKVELTNGAQQVCGDITFVIQPAENKAAVKLMPLSIVQKNLKENYAIANIVCEGFEAQTVEYSILNDPNCFFFNIKNEQLVLTQEGANAIIEQTLPLNEMQITVQAKDTELQAEAMIAIPVATPDSAIIKEQQAKDTTSEETIAQAYKNHMAEQALSSPKEQDKPAPVETATSQQLIRKSNAINQFNKIGKKLRLKQNKQANAKQASDNQATVTKAADNKVTTQTKPKEAADNQTNQEITQTKPKEKLKENNLRKKSVVKETAVNKKIRTKPSNVGKTNQKDPEEAILVDTSHFYFNPNKTRTDHIEGFIPQQDIINLTAIVRLREKKQINKHLYIEEDSSGTMTLNISSSGDGEVNQKFVFNNLNINKIAKIYQLNLTNLSNAQISHMLINSMLKNSTIVI